MGGAREAGEERTRSFDSFAIAARIDHDVPALGLRAGAADRTVEQDVAGGFQGTRGRELVGERKRAGIDDRDWSHVGIHDRHDGLH